MEIRGYRVFYIDPGEGVNDVIELIKTTTAGKLALVVHNRLLILNSQVNLKLIRKFAGKFKKEVVFINPDPLITEKIEEIGFKVFPDLNALESDMPLKAEAANSENNREAGKSAGFFKKFLGILIFVLVLALAYLYFLYPTATIEIKPVLNEASQEVDIFAELDLNRIDWENNILPLHSFEVTISDEDEINTTGSSFLGETKARGVVKFISELQEEKTIPAGTIVQTRDGVKFRTLDDAVVPQLQVDYLMDVPVGMKAGQAEVEIEALDEGTTGNIATGRITKMENEIDQVYVVNPEPTRGGTDKKISVVKTEDLERLKKNLDEKLKTKLLAKVYQELGGNYRVIDQEIEYTVTEFSFDKEAGSISETVKGTGTLTATGYLLRNNELDRLVTGIFQENLQDNYQLMSSGVNVEDIKLEESEDGMYNIKLELLALVSPNINLAKLKEELQGLSVADARSVLESRADIDQFRLNAKGDKLPGFSFAVKVIVSEPDSYQVVSEGE